MFSFQLKPHFLFPATQPLSIFTPNVFNLRLSQNHFIKRQNDEKAHWAYCLISHVWMYVNIYEERQINDTDREEDEKQCCFTRNKNIQQNLPTWFDKLGYFSREIFPQFSMFSLDVQRLETSFVTKQRKMT